MAKVTLKKGKDTLEVKKQNLPPLGAVEQLFGYVRNRWKEGWVVIKVQINDDEYLLFDKAYQSKIMGHMRKEKPNYMDIYEDANEIGL